MHHKYVLLVDQGILWFELHFPKNREPDELSKSPGVARAHNPPHDVCPSRPALQWCHANGTQKERSDPKIARSLWWVTVKVRNG